MKNFNFDNKNLRNQYDFIEWIEESGITEEALLSEFDAQMKLDGKVSRAVLKAKLFALICEKSCLAIDKDDIFQEKLFHGRLCDAWQRFRCRGASSRAKRSRALRNASGARLRMECIFRESDKGRAKFVYQASGMQWVTKNAKDLSENKF